MSAPAVLRTEALSTGYSGVAVTRELDLSVDAGEIVALLGRNGAGKTTTLHTIAGILPPVSGQIQLDGAAARGPIYKRARAGLALVSETRAIIRRLTVAENLRLGIGPVERGYDLFPELRPLANRKAGLLSGGEQQMLVLARVLASSPKLLLVDELSFGLAPLIVRRLLESLREAAERDKTAILLVEQHPIAALAVADRAYVLGGGRIVLSDTADSLRGRLDEIEESYLSIGPSA
jgi:branched-chain amino acid transport system ATP-binding protein